MKNFFLVILSGVLLFNVYGCVPILVGAAGGAGTAVWLSGKLSQEVNAPPIRVADAAKSVLMSMNLPITTQVTNPQVTQLRSVYEDGRKIWIDIKPLPQRRAKIEIRIGAMGDKTASESLLKKISDALGTT